MAGGSSPDTTPASANNPGFSSPLSLAMPMLNQGGAGNPFAALVGQIIRGAAQTPLQANPRQLPPGGDQQFNDFMMQVMNASQPQTYVPQTTAAGAPAPVAAKAAPKKRTNAESRGGNGSPSGRGGDSAGSPAGGSGSGGNGWGGH